MLKLLSTFTSVGAVSPVFVPEIDWGVTAPFEPAGKIRIAGQLGVHTVEA
jgi:hypothetical protein